MTGRTAFGQLDADLAVRRGEFVLEAAVLAEPGEVLGVIGPNGAGKTTLLRALAGLTPVEAGRIALGGQVWDSVDPDVFVPPQARPIGFVFQNYRLFAHLDVRGNVAFGPRCHRLGRRKAAEVADSWLDRLGLAELAGRKPAQLSGGQAQRVALARALAVEPALLLMDEPLAALDAQTRLDVRGELRSHLNDFGGVAVLVTHDPSDAAALADRLVVVEDGRIVQSGDLASIAANPVTGYVEKMVTGSSVD